MASTCPESTADRGTRFALSEARDCGSDEEEVCHPLLCYEPRTYQATQAPSGKVQPSVALACRCHGDLTGLSLKGGDNVWGRTLGPEPDGWRWGRCLESEEFKHPRGWRGKRF